MPSEGIEGLSIPSACTFDERSQHTTLPSVRPGGRITVESRVRGAKVQSSLPGRVGTGWRWRRTIRDMPASAYAVVALFTVVALLCGAAATWFVGPRRLVAVVIPSLAAFLALYWVGHKSGLELGPTMELLGFRIALVQDVIAGALAAVAAAFVQRWVLERRRLRGSRTEAP